MVAQTHLIFKEKKDEELEHRSQIDSLVHPDNVPWRRPSDVQVDRAATAFDAVSAKIAERDLNSDNLFEDLISEKSYKLDRVSNLAVSRPF